MNYDPKIHHRQSYRLKGHDYSRPSMYFITICTKYNLHLFGNVKNGELISNHAGKMISKWWKALPTRYSNIMIHDYIAMPNHFHAIIQIIKNPSFNSASKSALAFPARATQRGRPPTSHPNNANPDFSRIQNLCGDHVTKNNPGDHATKNNPGDHAGSPLRVSVGWFKTMTTNEYIRNVKQNDWPRFQKKLWQRNYYERIIRDENAFRRISQYIRMNPSKW